MDPGGTPGEVGGGGSCEVVPERGDQAEGRSARGDGI